MEDKIKVGDKVVLGQLSCGTEDDLNKIQIYSLRQQQEYEVISVSHRTPYDYIHIIINERLVSFTTNIFKKIDVG